MNNLLFLFPFLVAAGAFAVIALGTNAVFAAFPVENLNSFISQNQTSGEPNLIIVGELTNNGPDREDFVDISGTLYDQFGRIIGVQLFYEDDVKPGDTIPFQLSIPASVVQGGDLSRVADFKVTAE